MNTAESNHGNGRSRRYYYSAVNYSQRQKPLGKQIWSRKVASHSLRTRYARAERERVKFALRE